MKNLTPFDFFNIRLALNYSIRAWDKLIENARAEGNSERATEYLRISAGERETLAKLEGENL